MGFVEQAVLLTLDLVVSFECSALIIVWIIYLIAADRIEVIAV